MTAEAEHMPPEGLSWGQIIASIEAMDPADAMAMMPGSGTEKLVADFPELGRVVVTDVPIDGPGGPVPARAYRAPGASGTGFVWAHGGAFIGGHLDMDEAHWVALALGARGISVLSVDYRKCLNGVRFPAPSDDLLAAWRWAVAHAEDRGTAPDRLHLGGASAGANLAGGVTKRLRDGAGPMPASLVLVYPLVHAELPPRSDDLLAALAAAELVVDFPPEAVRELNLNFTGGEAVLADPYAFAANGDVSGQPPSYILNSEADQLRASGEAYAEQLRAAGVEVRVEFEPGTQHEHVNDPYSEQHAYRLEVDGTAGPRVESSQSVLVPWPAEPLGSRQQVGWRVRVWTDLGESPWSAPATFETGLLGPGVWQATWLEPAEQERPAPGCRPAYVLWHEFDLATTGPARLYATAHGIYETFLNGRRVGNVELAPGFTSYPHQLHVQSYDVADLVRAGRNTWEVVLSDGWYRGRTGFSQVADCYGDTTAFLGQLHMGDAVVVTDGAWRSAVGRITSADLMAGQASDHRRQPAGRRAVRVADHGFERLTASPGPPTRRVEELRPAQVRRLAADRHVVDLGQNINGWVRLSRLGPEGTTITLTHGEALGPDGDVTQDHLGALDLETYQPVSVGMIDRVVSAGREGEVFEPRHTTHGFRYVRVEGHPGPLTPDDVTGVVVHSDLRRTGWFRCSDDRINRFHDAAVWSFRGNACDIPTDCPQRERAGWTGDYQLFVPTAAFVYDVAGFSLKWLRDLVAEAGEDGCVRNVVPDPTLPRDRASAMWTSLQGSSGWGDAVTIVPWELWRAYGDDRPLRECWDAMVRWVEFAATRARTERHESRVARSPDPRPHEAFVWDGGFHWGEWLEPGAEPFGGFGDDKGDVGTAFLHRSARLAARTGRLLGHDAEAARLEELAAQALDAWRTEFIGPDGRLTPDTQANHVRALAFGLVPDELRGQTAARLVEHVRAAGTHLGTGFLATPDLLPVLAGTGHLDVAYELLLQDTPPSWLAMIERGATTVWEDWEGIGSDGTPKLSLNHYSKGAVISFLHTQVAGIQLVDDEPAYRRFRIAPQPGGPLTWAEAVHDSPYGRIGSFWRSHNGAFELVVTVPPGTTAEVVLPDGGQARAAPGTSTYACPV